MNGPASHNTVKTPAPALRIFAKLLVVATLVLLFLGGQVKSHDAGLSVPDWPWTFGENPITYHYSKWTGGIFHEHLHRLIAGVIALMTIALAVGLQVKESRTWLKVLGWVAVVAVLLQALLGGLTVIYLIPDAVSSAHGLLAQTFFLITIIIAYALSREWHRRKAAVEAGEAESASPIFKTAIILIIFLYGQLFLGALTRHTDSALAIPDFPTMGGKYIPTMDEEMLTWINDWRLDHTFETGTDLPDVEIWQVHLHLTHRLGAVIVTLFTLHLAAKTWRKRQQRPELLRVAGAMCVLVAIQFFLGVMTVLTAETPLIASLHLACGAAFLGLTTFMALRAYTFTNAEAHVPVANATPSPST